MYHARTLVLPGTPICSFLLQSDDCRAFPALLHMKMFAQVGNKMSKPLLAALTMAWYHALEDIRLTSDGGGYGNWLFNLKISIFDVKRYDCTNF